MALEQYRVVDEAESWLGKAACLVWGALWAPLLLADLWDRLCQEKLSSSAGIAMGMEVYVGAAIIMCHVVGVGQHAAWVLAGLVVPALLLQGLMLALGPRLAGAAPACGLMGWRRSVVEDGLTWLLPALWLFALFCLTLGVPLVLSLLAALGFVAFYPLHLGLMQLGRRFPFTDWRFEFVGAVDAFMLIGAGFGACAGVFWYWWRHVWGG